MPIDISKNEIENKINQENQNIQTHGINLDYKLVGQNIDISKKEIENKINQENQNIQTHEINSDYNIINNNNIIPDITNNNIIKSDYGSGFIKTKDNIIKNNDKKNYIIGHNMNFINTPIINEEIKNENIPIHQSINTINSEVQLILKVVGFENIPNNARLVKGNLTLNEIEKKVNVGAYVFDRGMSIRNLNKTLLQIQNEQNSPLIFYLMKKSEKLIKDLEECEINFINIAGQSCYQSATLQGFVHIIFPMAIKYINNKRQIKGYEKVENLDELKNDSFI